MDCLSATSKSRPYCEIKAILTTDKRRVEDTADGLEVLVNAVKRTGHDSLDGLEHEEEVVVDGGKEALLYRQLTSCPLPVHHQSTIAEHAVKATNVAAMDSL